MGVSRRGRQAKASENTSRSAAKAQGSRAADQAQETIASDVMLLSIEGPWATEKHGKTSVSCKQEEVVHACAQALRVDITSEIGCLARRR